MVTKAEAIHEEEDRAERNLQNAGFQEQQVYALMEAMRAIISAESLREIDARLIEGDDATEILGY